MTEELELFSEDTEEQLQFMENALLDATESGIDDEKIGAIFRAMHTIKGTAGMFGFDDVVSFTHVAENLLDEVRKGNATMSDEMLALMLKSKDHVDSLAQLSINEEEITSEITQMGEALIVELKAMMPGATPVKEVSVEADAAVEVSVVDTSPSQVSDKEVMWHISLRLKEDFFTGVCSFEKFPP